MSFIHIAVLAALLLAAVFLGRIISPSLLHPIRLFSVIWSVFVLVPVLFFDNGYRWTFGGFYWIVAAVLAMEMGGLIGKACFEGACRRTNGAIYKQKNFRMRWVWLFIVLLGGVVYVVAFLSKSGIQLSSITSFQTLLDINAAAAHERYYGDGGHTTMFLQILLTAVYMGSACGGYVFNFAKGTKQKIWSLLTLLPIMASTLLENTKAGLIASVFLWFSGWAISYAYIHGRLPVLSGRLLWRCAILGVAFISLLYFVMLLRVGDFSAGMRKVIFNKLIAYAFGQMVQFDGWFHGEATMFATGMGINTYLWFPKLLGFAERVHGVYQPYVLEYGSNIFTAFRGVLEDFGIVFGLLYMMVRGFLLEVCLCRVFRGNKCAPLAASLVLCAYVFILYGFIISPWIYTSYALAMIGFGAFVLLFHRAVKVRF